MFVGLDLLHREYGRKVSAWNVALLYAVVGKPPRMMSSQAVNFEVSCYITQESTAPLSMIIPGHI
jgi:hypothetical protein